MKHYDDVYGSIITAKEFEREAKRLLKEFLAMWAKRHQEKPKDFPKEMDLGDWWDQFEAYGNLPVVEHRGDDSDA